MQYHHTLIGTDYANEFFRHCKVNESDEQNGNPIT